MFAKLQAFQLAVDQGQAPSDFRDRLKFTKNEKSRKVAMHRIRDGNQKLERLLRGSVSVSSRPARQPRRKIPPTRTRRFSESLYNKMAGKWPRVPCECQASHEARLCLWNCCSIERCEESDDSLDMVVSTVDVDEDGSRWQESTIRISSERYVPNDLSNSRRECLMSE